ncbi:MAG TPA: hypothetical protein VMZ28_16515 [Kofleriaceae bacterium]|nr:hypothetical protein [Kofleriaceae bacterium]
MARILPLLVLLALVGCKEEEEGLGKPPASVSPKTVAAIDRTFAKLDGVIAGAAAAKRDRKAQAFCAHLATDVAPKLKSAAVEAVAHVPRKDAKIAKDGAEWIARYVTLEVAKRTDRVREVVGTCAGNRDVKQALAELAMAALAAHQTR